MLLSCPWESISVVGSLHTLPFWESNLPRLGFEKLIHSSSSALMDHTDLPQPFWWWFPPLPPQSYMKASLHSCHSLPQPAMGWEEGLQCSPCGGILRIQPLPPPRTQTLQWWTPQDVQEWVRNRDICLLHSCGTKGQLEKLVSSTFRGVPNRTAPSIYVLTDVKQCCAGKIQNSAAHVICLQQPLCLALATCKKWFIQGRPRGASQPCCTQSQLKQSHTRS